MIRVLVSACLVGRRVRYDGGSNEVQDRVLDRWRAEGRLVIACPELLGGLPVPRPAAEILDVGGERRVITGSSDPFGPRDVTNEFRRGALASLTLAQRHGCRLAVLKARSPSCGSGPIYDGTFSRTLIAGMGVTAETLTAAGVTVFDETEWEEAATHLAALEAGDTPTGLRD